MGNSGSEMLNEITMNGERKTPFLIGVGGGTASGKVSTAYFYFTL